MRRSLGALAICFACFSFLRSTLAIFFAVFLTSFATFLASFLAAFFSIFFFAFALAILAKTLAFALTPEVPASFFLSATTFLASSFFLTVAWAATFLAFFN